MSYVRGMTARETADCKNEFREVLEFETPHDLPLLQLAALGRTVARRELGDDPHPFDHNLLHMAVTVPRLNINSEGFFLEAGILLDDYIERGHMYVRLGTAEKRQSAVGMMGALARDLAIAGEFYKEAAKVEFADAYVETWKYQM